MPHRSSFAGSNSMKVILAKNHFSLGLKYCKTSKHTLLYPILNLFFVFYHEENILVLVLPTWYICNGCYFAWRDIFPKLCTIQHMALNYQLMILSKIKIKIKVSLNLLKLYSKNTYNLNNCIFFRVPEDTQVSMQRSWGKLPYTLLLLL